MSIIFLELEKLGIMRLQDAWAFDQLICLELYHNFYKRLYLIFDFARASKSFHVQTTKVSGSKVSTNFILALRKAALGQAFKFERAQNSEQALIASFVSSSSPMSLVFDLAFRYQAGLFINEKLIAQAHRTNTPQLFFPSTDIIKNSYDLSANFTHAVAYNLDREKLLKGQIYEQQRKKIIFELKKIKILKKNIEQDLDKCKLMLSQEQDAELLRVNLHKIKKGDRFVELEDYRCELPSSRIIELDPCLSPQKFLEKIFNNIKKSRRGIVIINERLEHINSQVKILQEKLSMLEEGVLPTPEALEPRKSARKNKVLTRLPYRVYISSDKIPLWVGRSAKDNDELTLHKTRGNEWWFHVQEGPGSHVIAKCSDDALKPETFLEAAMLAAYFSSHKQDLSVEIIYARVKNIKKPKKFAPGKVLVQNEKSFVVKIDKERLNKILERQN